MQRVRYIAADPENDEMCVVHACIGIESYEPMLISKHTLHSHDRGNIHFIDTTGRMSWLREFSCEFPDLVDVNLYTYQSNAVIHLRI